MSSQGGPALTFWGAARSVTGSMHLVEACGRKILLDCGLVRGPHGHAHPPGAHFPFDPASIDAVIISHAHIDHCGNLGTLIAQGFRGPIHCTPATRDLLCLVLRNSARIQEEDAFIRGVIGRPHADAPFTVTDVEQGLGQCRPLPYDQPREIAPRIQLRLWMPATFSARPWSHSHYTAIRELCG